MDDSLPSSGHRRTVTAAAASPQLAALSLAELRDYRERLREEEEKISYWRRLIHARQDLIRAGEVGSARIDAVALGRVLGDTGAGRSRAALHRLRAADPLPDLPDLDAVWLVPHDAASTAEAMARLVGAETRLTAYRHSLHERIDEATGELISRYRDQPSLALQLLRP